MSVLQDLPASPEQTQPQQLRLDRRFRRKGSGDFSKPTIGGLIGRPVENSTGPGRPMPTA